MPSAVRAVRRSGPVGVTPGGTPGARGSAALARLPADRGPGSAPADPAPATVPERTFTTDQPGDGMRAGDVTRYAAWTRRSPPYRRSYSSQAWITTCPVILPSRSVSIDSDSTRTPSAYWQLSQ